MHTGKEPVDRSSSTSDKIRNTAADIMRKWVRGREVRQFSERASVCTYAFVCMYGWYVCKRVTS